MPRSSLAIAVILPLTILGFSAIGLGFEAEPQWDSEDTSLLLPDGRALPDLPVRVEGEWDNGTVLGVRWQADLEIKGDEFAGKITFPGMTEVMVPLTVQGTHKGNIVEFSVRYNDTEVAHFGGHLAGTNLVGTFDGVTGQRGSWKGSWVPESFVVKDEEEVK